MLLKVKQAVEYLNGILGENAIYDMVRKDQIPTIKITGKRILFSSDRLDEWIANDCIMKEEWKRDKQQQRPACYGKLRQIIP